MGGRGDVVQRFVDSCNRAGIGVGFYYSLGSNNYAESKGWSPEELQAVERQQLAELWGRYGNRANGGLTEVWFDGGFQVGHPINDHSFNIQISHIHSVSYSNWLYWNIRFFSYWQHFIENS